MPEYKAQEALRKEMFKVKPISPNDVQSEKNDTIPDVIIKSVNELIVEKWDGYSSDVLQDDLVVRVLSKDDTLTKEIIFANKWFDFEDLFREEGWKVEYDSPAYNETYKASFKFSKKRERG